MRGKVGWSWEVEVSTVVEVCKLLQIIRTVFRISGGGCRGTEGIKMSKVRVRNLAGLVEVACFIS